MRDYHPAFSAALDAAPARGLMPVWFLWVIARNRITGADGPRGFWTGAGDVTVTVAPPDGSTGTSRTYQGGCDLRHGGITLVGDLSDQPVQVTLSQIAPAAQELVRGLDPRHAYCEVHAGLMDGGALLAPPQLEFVGYVDEAPITTPPSGGEGQIALSIRSELMHQLTAINPAKSSDAHQRRRQEGDAFSQYAGVIAARELQWFKG